MRQFRARRLDRTVQHIVRFTQHTEYAVDHCVEAQVQTAGATLEDDDVYGSQMTMHQIHCSCLFVNACVVLNASGA